MKKLAIALSLLGLVSSAAGCLAGSEGDGVAPQPAPVGGGKADSLFADGPMYLTGAFDGSQRFGMWVDTMRFARHIRDTYDKPLGFTYFINSCYFDETVSGSWIGKSHSRAESLVRWALAQQALDEGHEIGDHTVRHHDGSAWSYQQWQSELGEFHALVEKNLFRPVYEPGVGPVFPRWVARGVDRAVGASCVEDSDCDSGRCLPVAERASFCTTGCNKNLPCPEGTACGAPAWNQSQDVCVPLPEFPVSWQGELLFDEDGNPNLEAHALKPYRPVGFRAPQLGHNLNLYRVLSELGYRYDTSKILGVGAPKRVVQNGQLFDDLYELPLMKNPGSLTVPMDYNYKVNGGSYQRMTADYQQSIVDSYRRGRLPWNIGHHFALWQNGGYWRAMQDAFEFAAQGCAAGDGALQCEQMAFPTFGELVQLLDSKSDGLSDPFADPTAEGEPPVDGAAEPDGESHQG